MYSSSCGFLPNKKQSNFSGSHNFSLLCNYSKYTNQPNSFTNLLSSSPEMSPHSDTFNDKHSVRHDQFSSRTGSIMSFVYNLGSSSRFNQGHDICENLTVSKSRHGCKALVDHYNNMPSMPLVSSHLIGGFVGSKSQLGRTQGFEVKMWDIVRDLFSLVSNSPTAGKSHQKSLPIDNRCCGTSTTNPCEKPELLMHVVKSKDLDMEKPRKQSYADVTKSKLPVSKVHVTSQTSQNNINSGENKMKDSVKKYTPSCKAWSVIETVSKCSRPNQNISQNRDRITSECSADSEDSFIVFENCEGDIQVPDDISDSSDEENCYQINGALSSDNRSALSSTSTCGKATKKVRFAEGKNLKKVHLMYTWDYAYRKARPGPWEMLARDSERFRCRIKNTETVLKPVLEKRHREAVYQHRFAS